MKTRIVLAAVLCCSISGFVHAQSAYPNRMNEGVRNVTALIDVKEKLSAVGACR